MANHVSPTVNHDKGRKSSDTPSGCVAADRVRAALDHDGTRLLAVLLASVPLLVVAFRYGEAVTAVLLLADPEVQRSNRDVAA